MGVVLHDPYLEAISAGVGLTPGQRLDGLWRLRDPAAWPEFEMGQIDQDEFERRFWADPDGARHFDAAAFHAARRAGYRFMDGMEALIASTQATGLALHVASNYPVWIEEVRITFELDQRFHGVWASHHFGVRKPDRRFYDRLLDQVGQPAQACLFVDDRAENVAAAEAIGMRAHLFTSADDLQARLIAEGVRLS